MGAGKRKGSLFKQRKAQGGLSSLRPGFVYGWFQPGYFPVW
jgi:hypothetical protein